MCLDSKREATWFCTEWQQALPEFNLLVMYSCRSTWPSGRRWSVANSLLGLLVRIPPSTWTSVIYECCVFSYRYLRRADPPFREAPSTVAFPTESDEENLNRSRHKPRRAVELKKNISSRMWCFLLVKVRDLFNSTTLLEDLSAICMLPLCRVFCWRGVKLCLVCSASTSVETACTGTDTPS